MGLARAEADTGCPRLFNLKSDIAMYFADVTATWSPEERYHLMCERVKWLYTGNYGFPLGPVTEEEKAAGARWDYPWFGRQVRTQGKAGTEFIWLGGRKETVDAEKAGALQRYVRSQLGEFRIDTKLLKKQMREAMCSCFGKPVKGDCWLHAVKLKELEVTTMLAFGGAHGNQLEYVQRVHLVRGETRVWLLEYGGVGALLGWPQTIWCYLTNSEIPAAAELLVRLCGEFVDALPEMWQRSGLADVPLPGELM